MLRMLVQALPYALAVLSLGLSSLLFYRIRSFAGLALWPLKILAGSLAGFLLVGGVLGAALGLRFRAPLAAIAGAAGASLSALYLWRIATFMRALGGEPRGSGATELGLAASRPRWERDVPFWHLPAGHAPLLCDLWQPPEGVPPTGLAFVYLHSSSWHLADKDAATRPFFGVDPVILRDDAIWLRKGTSSWMWPTGSAQKLTSGECWATPDVPLPG